MGERRDAYVGGFVCLSGQGGDRCGEAGHLVLGVVVTQGGADQIGQPARR